MKRFVFFIAILFCNVVIADTININWKNGDTTYEQSTCTIGGNLDVPTIAPTKYGYDFVGWNVLAAKELEYVRFSGLQYINTGIAVDSDEISFDIKFRGGGRTQKILGTGKGYGAYFVSEGFGLVFDNTSNTLFLSTSISNLPSLGLLDLSEVYSCIINISNNSTKSELSGFCTGFNPIATRVSKITNTDNVYLGTANINNVERATPGFSGNIYYFRIKKDGVLVLDLIPALDPDGVVCFWDNISKTFFYNQGSGYLQAGPLKE